MDTSFYISNIAFFLVRWSHVLFGIAWVGLLYYFNFVQTAYFKEASEQGLADAKAKLAPRALAWFRYASLFTFITGLALFGEIGKKGLTNEFIVLGGFIGTLMLMNVWHVIWPQQKIVLGIKEGDVQKAAAKAGLASRTNTLYSAPMVFCMLASPHLGYDAHHLLSASGGGLGLWIATGIIVLIQINALVGKTGPITSIRGVIHMSLALTALLYCSMLFL